MSKKTKTLFLSSAIAFILFVIFTLLLKYINVKPAGPEDSLVGLDGLNEALTFSSHPFFYDLTKYLGYFALLLAVLYACTGFLQMIKRGGIAKVDKDLIALGGVYALTIVVFVFFEFVVINYRPVMMAEGLEASYPSTHTMLSIVVFLTSIHLARKQIKNKKLQNAAVIVCIALTVIAVAGRLISGVHWFTDIVGAVIISASLVLLFYALISLIKEKQNAD